jgi:hypothetical protein
VIQLEPQTHWCERHLKPFRQRWPDGYLPASLRILDHVVERDDITRACGRDEATGVLADVARLPAVLREFSPLCCLIGDEEAERITRLALEDPAALYREIHAVHDARRSA